MFYQEDVIAPFFLLVLFVYIVSLKITRTFYNLVRFASFLFVFIYIKMKILFPIFYEVLFTIQFQSKIDKNENFAYLLLCFHKKEINYMLFFLC